MQRLVEEVSSCQSPAQLAQDLEDACGYVREAAIARVVELCLVELLPALARRLNDWVPVIRDRARAGVLTLVPFAQPDQLLQALAEVSRLHAATRTGHGEWIARFEQALLQFVETQLLLDSVTGPDRPVARACFDLVLRHGVLGTSELAELGLRAHHDIVIARKAVLLAATLPEPEKSELCRVGLQSHFGAVKASALRTLVSTGLAPTTPELALAALDDPHGPVRSIATAWLAGRGVDVAAHYRQQLRAPASSARQCEISLGMLAALRSHGDLDLIRSFAQAHLPSARQSALAAWLKLAPGEKDQIARQALRDSSPRVRKFALRTIRKEGAYVAFDEIYENLTVHGDIRRMLQMCDTDKWAGLEAIGRLASGMPPGDENLDRARDALRAWIYRAHKTFGSASARQLQFLASAQVGSVFERLLAGHPREIAALREQLASLQGQASPRNR